MPLTFTIDPARKWVLGRASGEVTVDDIQQYMAGRVQQAIYDYPQIIDARGATLRIPATRTVVQSALDARRAVAAGAIPRTALVATPGTAVFGYARQVAAELGLSGHPIEVFDCLAEAEAWLAGDS